MTLLRISEDDLHKQVAEYLELALPAEACFTSTLNEGKRGWKYQKKVKDFRVMPGWPDITIIHQGRPYFIELKAPGYRINGRTVGKGYQTTDQKTCMETLHDCGAAYVVSRSLAEVQQALKAWNIGKAKP